MAVCRLRGLKSELVKDLCPVHSPVGRHEATSKQNTKSKPTNATQNTATQNNTAKPRRDRCQFMG